MADICTASTDPCASGNHRTITIGGRSYRVSTAELAEPLTDAERDTLYLLGARLLFQRGVSLADFANRVIVGEEATNVKVYSIIGAGAAVTKTNIGTAYVDVLPGANGQRSLIDFTGCGEFRVVLNANLVGSGQWGARLVRDGDSAVLFEAANLGAAGERELDTDWQPLPAAASGLTLVRLQAKSQTASDDPIFRRCLVLVR